MKRVKVKDEGGEREEIVYEGTKPEYPGQEFVALPVKKGLIEFSFYWNLYNLCVNSIIRFIQAYIHSYKLLKKIMLKT